MKKAILSSTLRKLGLLKFADKLRFFLLFIKKHPEKKRFLAENPNVKLPPDYYLYETFNLNYNTFYNKSIETAKWLLSYFKKYKDLNKVKILDWGCGPGRVIRHMPGLVNPSCELVGCDYNKKYITWCQQNIENVEFKKNELIPPLPFENDSFDIIYGISIFTHLSKEMHYKWFDELVRISKKDSIMLLTSHGNVFKTKLTPGEVIEFKKGNLIIKGNTKEGHRTFGAFHPPSFMRKLFKKHEILEYIEGREDMGKLSQDVWVLKVKK